MTTVTTQGMSAEVSLGTSDSATPADVVVHDNAAITQTHSVVIYNGGTKHGTPWTCRNILLIHKGHIFTGFINTSVICVI